MGTPIDERESSWPVEGVTLTLLRHITSLGYIVSVHRLTGSLLGAMLPSVEMHAVIVSEPAEVHSARVELVEGEDCDYRCACLLCESVGIDLEDG